jgi:hypothetical protein
MYICTRVNLQDMYFEHVNAQRKILTVCIFFLVDSHELILDPLAFISFQMSKNASVSSSVHPVHQHLPLIFGASLDIS